MIKNLYLKFGLHVFFTENDKKKKLKGGEEIMITWQGAAEYVRHMKAEYKITGSIDSARFAGIVGVSQDELCCLMTKICIRLTMEKVRLRDEYNRLLREKECLEESLKALTKNNVEKQQLMVKAGLPIAKKSARISEIRLLMKLGDSDKEIMKSCGISRTTLWRYKKEIKEREQNGTI